MSLCIFDFDGVLADSFEQVYTINCLAIEYVGGMLTREEFKKIFFGKFHENLSVFLNEKHLDYAKFINHKSAIYVDHYNYVNLFPFSKQLVIDLKQQGNTLVIISAAPEDAIRRLLKKYDLEAIFQDIYGINRSGKLNNILESVHRAGVTPEQTYFITDTVGDIEEGKNARVKTIGVTWGFHDQPALTAANPDAVIAKPADLLLFICQN